MFFWEKDQISSGWARGGMGERPKMRVIFMKFPLLRKIQTVSQKLLVRQTSNHCHCNWHAQKPYCRDFQVILSSSSWSKTTLCIFKEQIWLPNRKCYGKNNLYFDQEEMLKWLDTPHLYIFGHANSKGMAFEAVHSDVSEL